MDHSIGIVLVAFCSCEGGSIVFAELGWCLVLPSVVFFVSKLDHFTSSCKHLRPSVVAYFLAIFLGLFCVCIELVADGLVLASVVIGAPAGALASFI